MGVQRPVNLQTKEADNSILNIYVYIYEVKLAFEMLIVHEQQRSFLTHERVFVKVSKFLRQKMSRPEGDLNTQSSDSFQML